MEAEAVSSTPFTWTAGGHLYSSDGAHSVFIFHNPLRINTLVFLFSIQGGGAGGGLSKVKRSYLV